MNYKELRYIIDSQETASIKEARKLLVSKAGMTDEQADKWVRGDLRGAFPILRDKKAAKFILGVTRLFVEQQLNSAEAQNKMARILKEINEAHYEEYDRNLNGKSLDDLYGSYKDKFAEADKASRVASEGKSYDKSDYEITGPFRTFAEAKKAWGNDSQDWCVFHMENMFETYTSAGQQFYVAAKHGWKDIPRQAGEDAPKDDYGNSLIAVSVNLDGSLATATPRWNHANGGGDSTYSVEELEKLLQVPFYKTFKPKETKTIATWGEGDVVKVTEADGLRKYLIGSHEFNKYSFNTVFSFEGNRLEPLFKEALPFEIKDKGYNALKKDGTLLSHEWYFRVYGPSRGVVRVAKKDKDLIFWYNYINLDGKLLSKVWFIDADNFEDNSDYTEVEIPSKGMNLMDRDGNFKFPKWYSYIRQLSSGTFEGGAIVYEDKLGGQNIIKPDGSLLSDTWYDSIGTFEDGRAIVERGNKCGMIDDEGKLLTTEWFDGIGSSESNGFRKVRRYKDGRYECNLLKRDGTLLSSAWFKDMNDTFQDGWMCVTMEDGFCNFVNLEGKLISKEGFYDVGLFREGFAAVSRLCGEHMRREEWNFIDTKGNFLSDVWFDWAGSFNEGTARVTTKDDRKGWINKDGNIKLVDSAWKKAMGLLKKIS